MDATSFPAESVTAEQLRSYIERIEHLEEEKAGIASDIEIYSEAKGNGFDTKVMRKLVALRKRDYAERREEEAILDLYMRALGMLADTPLGKAAVARDFGNTKMTITTGGESVETTVGHVCRVADGLKTPVGRKILRKAIDAVHDGSPA
jgi:uncharacterized protein (UPF0335 family)